VQDQYRHQALLIVISYHRKTSKGRCLGDSSWSEDTHQVKHMTVAMKSVCTVRCPVGQVWWLPACTGCAILTHWFFPVRTCLMLRTDCCNVAAQSVDLELGDFVRKKNIYGFFYLEITRLRRNIWVFRPASRSI